MTLGLDPWIILVNRAPGLAHLYLNVLHFVKSTTFRRAAGDLISSVHPSVVCISSIPPSFRRLRIGGKPLVVPGVPLLQYARAHVTSRNLQEITVPNRLNLSVFYLLGGLGFLVLAAIVFLSSPQRDAITLLSASGMLLAGLLAITAFFGIRRNRAQPPRP